MKAKIASLSIVGVVLLTSACKHEPGLKVSLQRTACFGTCPTYVVEVDKTGSVASDDGRSCTVDAAGMASLRDTLVKNDVFGLDDEYKDPISDMPSEITRITLDGRSKTITRNTGAINDRSEIKRLIAIENAIDAVCGGHHEPPPRRNLAPTAQPWLVDGGSVFPPGNP